MILAKGLSKTRFSIVFTFATSLVIFSLLKLTVLQQRKLEGGESRQQHSGENLLEKVRAIAITIFAVIVKIIVKCQEELDSLPEVLRIDNWPEGLRLG